MLFVLLFANIFAFSHQTSVWDTLTANIAVVEFRSIYNNISKPDEQFSTNLAQYAGDLDFLKDEKLDMIIFPESTLNVKETAVEIQLDAVWDEPTINLLEFFSHNTYIVLNLVEKEKCKGSDGGKNCKKFGYHFYNTDVVFDRKGVAINKYRKYNLFGEKDLDKPETAEQVVIKTDFGVTFGIFTCFDILFNSPALDLLSQNIDGIIFPSMWFSELPFLTALQTQQMWSQSNDIAFFAAGANSLDKGSGGSGAYLGSKGLVVGGISTQPGGDRFLYKSVEGEAEWQEPDYVDHLSKQMDDLKLSRDSSIDDYTSWLLNTSATSYDNLCVREGTDAELCCNVTLKMSTKEAKPGSSVYTYHLVVFTGVRSFSGVYNGGIELCGIIACLNSSLSSCGRRFPNYDQVDWPVTFEEITITASFKKSENKTQFPNSLLSSIRPIEASKTVWSSEEFEEDGQSLTRRTWSTTEKQDRLLTFAIYGRDFGKDSAPPDDDDDDDDDKPGAGNCLEFVNFWFLLCCSLFLTKFVVT